MMNLKGLKQNILLKDYTTFKIGGPARYFYVAKEANDIKEAINFAKENKVKWFILSGGSNILFSDEGFDGLVILIKANKYKISTNKVYAEAGVLMSKLVKETGKLGLSGFEWAGGLPGSVGGAVRGNAGAFGGETKDIVEKVEFLDKKGSIKILKNRECKFKYRSSIFKQKNLIILSATFSLKKGNKKEIQELAKSHIAYRKEKHPLEFANAGSVFKNCDLKKLSPKLQKKFKDFIKVDPFPVVPTAVLLVNANLKGLKFKEAMVSKKHPNYIINLGRASFGDVFFLIEKVKKIIKKKFNVDLEEEVTILK